MTIETAGVPSELLIEYSTIPIAFEVTSVLSAQRVANGPFVLAERRLDSPYLKDYDVVGDRPQDWVGRFDTSRWGLFVARSDIQAVGGATIALGTSDLDMLEGRTDLAVVWDIRITPARRRRGVGLALFQAAEAWAIARGCRELKVETQNINVAACRFYAAMGCQLRVIRQSAYPQCPDEDQYLWYKPLPPIQRR
jgi:GNAT superfamily N-acetyltransferase